MAEVILHRSAIGALVGEVVATGKPEDMRPDTAEFRLLAGKRDDVVHGVFG